MLQVAKSHGTYPYLWESITMARKEAVEASRRLMAEKADWMDADMEISVNVRSALEWRPVDWE